jgi:hypothetical protein
MPSKKVNTATLIRGSLYTLRHPNSTPQDPKDALRFEYGKPVVIDDADILRKLENMYDEIQDGDGEVYEKPRFRVDRGVPMPTDEDESGGGFGTRAKPKRLSATRKVKRRTA